MVLCGSSWVMSHGSWVSWLKGHVGCHGSWVTGHGSVDWWVMWVIILVIMGHEVMGHRVSWLMVLCVSSWVMSHGSWVSWLKGHVGHHGSWVTGHGSVDWRVMWVIMGHESRVMGQLTDGSCRSSRVTKWPMVELSQWLITNGLSRPECGGTEFLGP